MLVYRYRFVILAAWALALVAAAPLAARAPGVLVSSDETPAGSESAHVDTLLRTDLGQPAAEVFVVFHSPSTPVSDPSYQRQVAGFVGAVTALPDIVSAMPGSAGADGHTQVVEVGLAENASAAAQHLGRVRAAIPRGPARAYVTGSAAVLDDFNRIAGEDVARADGIALPIALAFLLVLMRSVLAAPLPPLLAVVSVTSTLAAIYGIASRVPVDSFVLNIVSIIGLGASIDYSLLLVRRFREELHRDGEIRRATVRTIATAGEAIVLGGLTIAIGFVALLLTGVPVLVSVGLGGILVITATVLSALTLLPAILAVAGDRIQPVRLPPRASASAPREAAAGWHALALWVTRRPVLVAVAAVALLVAAGWPVLLLNTGSRDATSFPPAVESRQGLELLRSQFPDAGTNPVLVLVQTADGSPVKTGNNLEQLATLSAWLRARPSVVGLDTPAAAGSTALITLRTDAALDSPAARSLVAGVRAGAAAQAPGLRVLVGGAQASSIDFTRALYSRFVVAVGFVLAATYVLLLAIFRSVLLPLKAVLMNTLSVAAAYGVLVIVFQWGAGASLLGFTPTGIVDHVVPVLLFGVLFGVSMDYEVFLLSRVREAWIRSRDNQAAVVEGLEQTGGVITSAAILFCLVTVAFVFTRQVLTKEVGVGITAAVLLDVIVVRSLLVPATLCLLGPRNWWFPKLPWRAAGAGQARSA